MASATSTTTDLITCPICDDTYDNPKSLPCLHAFCLKCIKDFCKDKVPGDRAACPVCREEFVIPTDGVGHLKHHFIVQQLVDRENERQGSYCEQHTDKEVEVYCHKCKENICMKCYADKHRNHDEVLGLIPEVADNFRQRMNDDDQQIQSVINAVREESEENEEAVTEFISNVEEEEKKVLSVGDVVKHSVDSQVNELLTELQSVKAEGAEQAKSVQEANRQALVSLESFHTQSRELLDKGRPCDITRAACMLHDRATELLDNDVTAVKYHPPDVAFTPADVTQVKRLSLVGKLTVRAEEQPGSAYLHS